MDFHAFLFWVIGGLTSACAIATVVTHNIVRSATWLLFTLAGTSGLFFLIGADLVGAIQLLVYVGGTMILVVFGVMLTAQGPFISMRTSSAEWAVSAATGITLLALLLLSILANKPVRYPLGDAEPVIAFAPKHNLSDPDKSGNAAKSSYTMVIGQGFAGVGVGPAHKDPNHRPVPLDDRRKNIGIPDDMKKGVLPADEDEEPQKAAKIDDLDVNLKRLVDADKVAKAAEPTGIVRMNYLLPFEIISVHLLVVLIGAAYLARPKRREAKS